MIIDMHMNMEKLFTVNTMKNKKSRMLMKRFSMNDIFAGNARSSVEYEFLNPV